MGNGGFGCDSFNLDTAAGAWHDEGMMNQPPQPPPRRDPVEETRRYVDAVARTMVLNLPALARWLTVTCPECNRSLAEMDPGDLQDHLILQGAVVVACEGYFVINPVAAGLGQDFAPNWCDWTVTHCEGCEREMAALDLDEDLLCRTCATLAAERMAEDAKIEAKTAPGWGPWGPGGRPE